jgi:hypothetical protein
MDLVYAASDFLFGCVIGFGIKYCWETSDFYPFAQCCGGSSNEERKIVDKKGALLLKESGGF